MKGKINPSSPEDRKIWLEHVAARKRSGDSRAAYCRQHKLVYHQLRDWEEREEQSSKRTASPKKRVVSPFVRITQPRQVEVTCNLKLDFPGGVAVSVPSDFDMRTLARLITLVGGGAGK